MNISKTVEGTTTTIALEGWLDIESSAELGEYVDALEPAGKLVLDLDSLEYISSSGVRQIVAIYRKQKAAESEFEVVNANVEIMDVLSMTGITKKISISGK